MYGRYRGDACLAQAEAEARAAEPALRALRQKEQEHEAALRRAGAAHAAAEAALRGSAEAAAEAAAAQLAALKRAVEEERASAARSAAEREALEASLRAEVREAPCDAGCSPAWGRLYAVRCAL